MDLPCPIPDLATALETLMEVVDDLPPTADEIAKLLAELGIKGARKSGKACALANLILDQVDIPLGVELRIIGDAVFLMVGDAMMVLDLPENAYTFLSRFDSGGYPTLVSA